MSDELEKRLIKLQKTAEIILAVVGAGFVLSNIGPVTQTLTKLGLSEGVAESIAAILLLCLLAVLAEWAERRSS